MVFAASGFLIEKFHSKNSIKLVKQYFRSYKIALVVHWTQFKLETFQQTGAGSNLTDSNTSNGYNT